jgi:Big-like domain-containing protein
MRTPSLFSLVVATAMATLGCQSGATAPLTIDDDPTGLTVVPSIATVDGGKFLKLTASLHLADGSRATASDVTWLSADGTIASVGTDGVVHGLKAGQVQIVATWHDSRGSSLVTVIDPAIKGEKPPRCLEPIKAGTGSGIPTQGGCA